MTSATPWWERPRLCRESTPQGCHYSFYTQLECRTEPGEDGVPVKRCIRLHKRLLNCPGRAPVTDEQKQETETTYGEDADSSPRGLHLHPGVDDRLHETQAAAQPQPPDVGEALDQVLRLAENLQEEMVPTAGVRLDTPPPGAAPAPHAEQQSASGPDSSSSTSGLLSRLFPRHREYWGRHPSQVESQKRMDERWGEFAREFQET